MAMWEVAIEDQPLKVLSNAVDRRTLPHA